MSVVSAPHAAVSAPDAARDLADRDQFLHDLFEASPDCLKMLDLDGRLMQMNTQGLCLMEIDDFVPFVGADWPSFWPSPGDDRARHAVATARSGAPSGFVGPCPTAKGTHKWWDVRVLPVFDSDGAVVRLMSVSRDITERVEAERRLVEANETLEARVAERTETLEAMNRSLRSRNRDLQDLARLAEHDLQEPLRRLVTYADLLRGEIGDGGSDDVRHYTDRIAVGALRLRSLVQDLGTYSRLAQKELTAVPVHLAAVAEGVVRAQAAAIEAAGATVHIDVPSLPTVSGDAPMLHLLVHHLVRNALAAVRPDAPLRIDLRGTAVPDEDAVALVVEDTGCGFDARHAERLFRPFQRLDTADPDADTGTGTGIGLALVRLVAERHGGHAYADSTEGVGSRFTVTFPADLLAG